MKRHPILYLPCYLVNLCIMAFTAWTAPGLLKCLPTLAINLQTVGIAMAVLFCLLAILSHSLSKRRTPGYLLSYTLNALGSGLCVGTVLSDYELSPLWNQLPTAILPGMLLGILICLGCLLPKGNPLKTYLGCIFALTVVQSICGIVLWFCGDCVIGSFLLFSGLYVMLLPIACMTAGENPKDCYRLLSFSGFGAFILILLVALLLLSEGELLEELDFGGGESTKKKKKKKSNLFPHSGRF